LKLEIEISETTVSKYMIKRQGPPSQNWRTFLQNNTKELIALDFFTIPTATFRVLFVLVILSHDRRRILHFNVTEHPTAAWTARQLLEACGKDNAPCVSSSVIEMRSMTRHSGARSQRLTSRRFRPHLAHLGKMRMPNEWLVPSAESVSIT